MRWTGKTLAAFALLGWSAVAAQAGLKICNDTDERRAVSIGYKSGEEWMSEGWWMIEPGECAEPVTGDLKNRYYYFRAEAPGGEFDGEGYMFCTQDDVFTIVGDSECEARGYVRESFAAIDTGETALSFEHRIAAASPPVREGREGREAVDVGDPGAAPAPRPAPRVEPSQEPSQEPGPKERPTIAAPAPAPELSPEPVPAPDPSPSPAPALSLPGFLPPPTVSGTRQSGLTPGQHGTPFSARLVFQGCDYFEGLSSCAFIGDGTRYIAEIDAPTPYEFLEAYIDVPPGKIMDVSGDITSREGTGAQIAVTEITVVTDEDPYAEFRSAMQGSWVAAEGGTETLTIFAAQMDSYSDGNYVDTYFIDIKPSCPESAGAGPVMIQTSQQHGDSYCYLIDNLAGGWMDLILMGHEARVSFRKVE